MTSLRKFHSIAALCGDGLRPELQALFERLAVDPHSELFVRNDGMVQSGPTRITRKRRWRKMRARPGRRTAISILFGARNSSRQTEALRVRGSASV